MKQDFYRIEGEATLRGPYQSGDGWSIPNDYDLHPNPVQEGLWGDTWEDYEENKKFVCGFKDIEQLFRWFAPQTIKNLDKTGKQRYNVIRFQVNSPHVRVGERQAVALRHRMIEIERWSLSVFLTLYAERV